MARVQIGNAYVGPSGDLYGSLDGSAVGGLALAGGDKWYRTSVSSSQYPYPTYTDHPVVKYAQLYQSGDTFDVVMNARASASPLCASGFYLEIPAGFDEMIVNPHNQGGNAYRVYQPKCYGIWGQGPDQSRISVAGNSMSSGDQARVPAQGGGTAINPLYIMRLGPNGPDAGQVNIAPLHNYGWTLAGRDQQIDSRTGLPFNHNGLAIYFEGSGSTHTWLRMQGVGAGDYNNPPGETPQINVEKCLNPTLTGVEMTGINLDGTKTSGSLETNGSTNVVFTDVYAHDSKVSGVTWSTEGSAQGGQRTTNITTNRLRALRNANVPTTVVLGQGFPGINHEGVAGTVQHNYPEIIRQNANVWNGCHLFIGNAQGSCTLNVIEPNYHPEIATAQPPYAHGCFAVQCLTTYAGGTNQQKISDITVILNGVSLTPVTTTGAPATSADPARNFVVLTA